ncbi:MAG: group 1 glycosyl transferase, partial [Akkermansiaceae bacterium]|nr:group 1 glycosyl transferase [Akkermansiaceae bacterium]
MSASTDPHLRIVFVVSADQKTGTYFRYHNLAVCLQRRGHTVTVLSQASHRFGWKSETRDRVEYILAPSFPGNRWLYFSSNPMNLLYRHLRSAPEADVFHLFQPFPNAAWSWLRLRKTRRASLFAYDWDDLLLNEHSSLLLQRTFKDLILGKLAQWTELHLPRFAHLVTAISQELALLATKRGARWVELLHNGCLPSDPPTRAAARAQLGLKPDALYLGFTGWAAPEMDWILNAVAKLVDEHPRLRIAFSGVHPNDVVDLSLVPGVAERIDYFRFETAEECRVLQSALDLGLLPL